MKITQLKRENLRVEVSGLEPPTSTLRRWLWQTSADVGGPSAQVIDLFTPQRTAVNGGGRGMTAG